MNPRELPGRLGTPESTLLTDKRTDPRIVAALEAMGAMADGAQTPAPGVRGGNGRGSSYDDSGNAGIPECCESI